MNLTEDDKLKLATALLLFKEMKVQCYGSNPAAARMEMVTFVRDLGLEDAFGKVCVAFPRVVVELKD